MTAAVIVLSIALGVSIIFSIVLLWLNKIARMALVYWMIKTEQRTPNKEEVSECVRETIKNYFKK